MRLADVRTGADIELDAVHSPQMVATCEELAAVNENIRRVIVGLDESKTAVAMSAVGPSRRFRNVRFSAACGG